MQYKLPRQPLRVVVAPDSFKGSLAAADVASALSRGLKKCPLPPWSQAVVRCLPMADGGEGTAAALVAATAGKFVSVPAHDPLGRRITARFGVLGDGRTAVVDVAEASGLTRLAPEHRNPFVASSRGTGELIAAALDRGCRRIIVGVGGSATNDGGIGLAQALGVRFYDGSGASLGPGGGQLGRLARIDVSEIDPRLAHTSFVMAADVDNPLVGPTGATKVYAAQKGADPTMVEQLEAHMVHYANVVRQQTGVHVASMKGAGAAGGIGACLMAFFGAEGQRGFAVVSRAVRLDEHMAQADLVITGEGRIDGQTAFGKVAAGVGQLGNKYRVPVIAVAGEVAADAHGLVPSLLQALVPIVPGPGTLAEAMAQARHNLEQTGERIAAMFSLGVRFASGGK